MSEIERVVEERPLPGLEREDEEKQLAEIIGVAQNNLDRAKSEIGKLNDDLADLMEVYDAEDKEGWSLWNNATAQLKEAKRNITRFERARSKPYFGRIDFKDPNMAFPESYYIGRMGIARNASEPLVIDWRAPIASVYYENSLGPCKYTVSSEGIFEIDLQRKRTYEIENDKLKDFFDSDVVANDELLTKYLAKNKKAVLGEIIATIQQEQNMIIRRSPKTNVIIQGVAGSGKTTVAMHRISYILYNYEEDFRPEDFYIIGSNRILLNYITGVLPELDVYGVKQMTMEQLFIRLLYEDWDDSRYSYHSLDKNDEKNSVKGSLKWFKELEAFCWEYESKCIPRDEVYMEKTGNILVGKNLIDTYLRENPDSSMQSKILMLNEIIYSKYENEIQGKDVSFPAREKKVLDKKYSTYFGKDDWKGSIFELYQEFLQEQVQKGYEVDIPDESFDVYDLAALAYLYKRIKEIDPIREASHVVIDEAQDFGMMAYSSLHYCLRGCTYTIMGDTSQNIHFQYGLNDWDELRELILTGTYDAFGLLRKSYRNTVEISDFATEILRHGDFSIYPVEPIIRHGKAVRIDEYKDVRSLIAESVNTIRNWKEEGYETIAVVCRDEKETSKVTAELQKHIDVLDDNLESAEFGNGVMVLPVVYTKGLEFDAVLLFDPSERKYPADNGHVKLLYVAATRALHELTILHRGNLTKLIAEPAPEEKHLTELYAETLTKAKEYDKLQLTEKEIEEQLRVEGRKEMALRNYIGPKRVAPKPEQMEKSEETLKVTRTKSQQNTANPVRNLRQLEAGGMTHMPQIRVVSAETYPPKNGSTEKRQKNSQSSASRDKNAQSAVNSVREADAHSQPTQIPVRKQTVDDHRPINTSEYMYGGIPDNGVLRPKGHSRVNTAVKWVKKTKKYIDIASNYGLLRLTPVSDECVRVSFVKGQLTKIHGNYWTPKSEQEIKWTARESKSAVEVATEKLVIKIEKADGALRFMTPDKKLLLSENPKEPRLVENGEAWCFFDFEKKEKLKSKGILATDLMDLSLKAKYISFGGKPMRMPLVVSDKGYAIAVAAEKTAMFCGITMYGQYIYTDVTDQLDYYFMYGGSTGKNIEMHKAIFG